MKRRTSYVSLAAGLLTILALAGCSNPQTRPGPKAETDSGWIMPPTVEAVQRSGAGLTVTGRASPRARVVLRQEGGTAYAASADDGGRFELAIQPPADDMILEVETQVGQDATPSPYRMLVSRALQGPIALLSPGAPTLRLDPSGPLDVIDSDGRAVLASGRATPGSDVQIAVAGRGAVSVRAGRNGRWTYAATRDAGGGGPITVNGRRYDYPGPALGSGPGLTMISSGSGWLAAWDVPPKSRQSSWFPGASG